MKVNSWNDVNEGTLLRYLKQDNHHSIWFLRKDDNLIEYFFKETYVLILSKQFELGKLNIYFEFLINEKIFYRRTSVPLIQLFEIVV